MTSKNDDKELVLRIRNGDKTAFDKLVLKYQKRLQGPVSRIVNDKHEIEDIIQETFLKAYISLPNFRNDSSFFTWLYRIAINVSINYLKTQSRRPPKEDIDAEIAEHLDIAEYLRNYDGPQELLIQKETAIIVQKAIDKMPLSHKRALIMREMEGLTYKQITEAMGCPVGTTRSRIHRARELIKKAQEK